MGSCLNALATCAFYDRLKAKTDLMQQVHLNLVRNAALAAINADVRADALYEFFKHGAQVFIVAGALRDAIAAYYDGEGPCNPRDFDIVVASISRELFDGILADFGRRNRHGGYILCSLCSPDWDVWRLEETIGLKKTHAPRSLENMLSSFNLNCNAIALDVRTGLFLDAGAIDAIRRKRLGFADDVIYHSTDTFAAKALLLHLRLNYQLTDEMRAFVAANLLSGSLLHEASKVLPCVPVLSFPRLSKL